MRILLGFIGAVITIISAMIAGLRIERWLAKRFPGPQWPDGLLILVGLIFGLGCVAVWFI